MKTTLKIGAVTALLVGSVLATKAQTTTPSSTPSHKQEFRLSVGPEFGLPVGSLHDAYNWNFGGSVQIDIPVAPSLYVTANAGYNNFFVKKNMPIDKNLQLVPVKAGLKYFPGQDVFYVQGEAGAAFLTNKSDLLADNAASFVWAPQIGALVKLADKNYLDLGVRYESAGTFYKGGNANNYFGLRVAYSFGL